MAKVVTLEKLPEVFLTENITKESATRVVEQLAAYRDQGVERVALTIYSDGGEVKAGNFIAKWIANPATGLQVECRVIGNASSAAMIVAASCHTRYIASGSFANIHYAYPVGPDGEIIAEADQDAEVREALTAINADQVALFQRVSGKTKAQVEALMRQDRDVPSEKAVEFGLFDGIIPQKAALAALKSINMAEDTKPVMRAFKLDRTALAAAVVTGEVKIPESEILASNAEEVTKVKEAIEAKTKELDELKASMVALETAKTTAEASAADAVKAKETAELEVVAAKAETAKYVAAIDELKKNPLVAQTLPDGTSVVIPDGAKKEAGEGLSREGQRVKNSLDTMNEYFARQAKQTATA